LDLKIHFRSRLAMLIMLRLGQRLEPPAAVTAYQGSLCHLGDNRMVPLILFFAIPLCLKRHHQTARTTL
jgi:hypothetical protein